MYVQNISDNICAVDNSITAFCRMMSELILEGGSPSGCGAQRIQGVHIIGLI